MSDQNWKRPVDDWDTWCNICTNAMYGITDPAAYVEAVETLVKAARDVFVMSTEPGILDVDEWKDWKKRSENELLEALAALPEQTTTERKSNGS